MGKSEQRVGQSEGWDLLRWPLSRSAASESPMYLSATGMITMVPNAGTMKRMLSNVKRIAIAFSFKKPRFSCSPHDVLQSENPRAYQKCEPEGPRTLAMRVSYSRATRMTPPGRTPET